MHVRRSRERKRHVMLTALDTALFVFAGLASAWLAYLLLAESLHASWELSLLVVFWLLVAYLVLPRAHRALSYIYVPDYFIGRTRTSDGLLGDAVNLAMVGSEAQVHSAMTAAGWMAADDVTLASSLRIVAASLSRRSYSRAPVSPLYLFGRRQDFAYQQEVEGNPAQRHHVRFWRCPDDWWLPGGHRVDWVAAGTYDRSVGLSLMTFQITHRIGKDIDSERDYIVSTLAQASPEVKVRQIRHFATGYHARNGGGDEMDTDGDLPVVDLRGIVPPAPVERASPVARPATKRPVATTFSAGVAGVQGLIGIVTAGLLLADPDQRAIQVDPGGPTATAVAAGVVIFVAGLGLLLGVATYFGSNWARVLLMLSCTSTIIAAFLATTAGSPRPTLGTGLPHIGLGILVLLALTSPAARQFAQHRSPIRGAV